MNSSSPMTKTERADIQRLIRNTALLAKAHAKERSAHLRAEFERQMATTYSYSQDEVWREAAEAAQAAVKVAAETVEQRCEELGIPKPFRPSISVCWNGRGENAVKSRQVELRRVASTRITALEAEAVTRIETKALEASTRLLATGLTTEAATEFLESLPKVDDMMPALEVSEVKALLANEAETSWRVRHDLGIDDARELENE